ncbi:Pentatricopeptide repeat-containing protein, mitochondrial [Glycine soja]|uniref:Pentatricopeptide repeat-containing protein, mitochondrial n=1 Tax=Glycine soja TaxID=3848 RepID=A0A0B2PD75_GLYSO|nr:Pentatricopeptide repeat-containing protein, mitochondrial [Glycine soja]
MKRCNVFISRLCKEGKIDNVRKVFDEMPEWDIGLWTTMITGYLKYGMIREARKLFDRRDAKKNVVTWTAMANGYIKFNQVKEAERMSERDVVSWTTIITTLVQCGTLFDQMPVQNVVSWNAMIMGHAQNRRLHEALELFQGLPERDMHSWNTMITGFIQNGKLNYAEKLFGEMREKNVITLTAMMMGYVQHGLSEEALKMFDDGLLSQRDLISWNGMIAGYAHHGACSHTGLVEEGLKYFDEILKNRSIQLREDHYACLVDLCGRTGRLKEAFNIIEGLGEEAPLTVWGVLLARLGKWKEAANIRMKMKDKGLKKQPGCSWIEVGNTVQVFVVDDKSRSQYELLGHLLHGLHTEMK